MPAYKSPVFRKPATPWYHTKTAYGVTMALMLLVFMFGLFGIAVSREYEQYNGYVWVPALLVVLSGGLLVSTTIRLIRRYISK
jgi:hypothetical protein